MDSFTNAASVALNAGFAWLLRQSFQPEFVFASVFLLVLLALQILSAIRRARRMRDIEDDMEDLRAANTDLRSALETTKRKVAEATLAIATKSDAREKKITGELQLIERLVREFAASAQARAERAAAVEQTAAASSAAVADTPMLEII